MRSRYKVLEFKSYTAFRVVECLEKQGNRRLLQELVFFKRRGKTECRYQFWQEGYHPQAVTTDEAMLQKMEYIHGNPVRRGLVARPEYWRYSTETGGEQGVRYVLLTTSGKGYCQAIRRLEWIHLKA